VSEQIACEDAPELDEIVVDPAPAPEPVADLPREEAPAAAELDDEMEMELTLFESSEDLEAPLVEPAPEAAVPASAAPESASPQDTIVVEPIPASEPPEDVEDEMLVEPEEPSDEVGPASAMPDDGSPEWRSRQETILIEPSADSCAEGEPTQTSAPQDTSSWAASGAMGGRASSGCDGAPAVEDRERRETETTDVKCVMCGSPLVFRATPQGRVLKCQGCSFAEATVSS
jgi:hypothetical protein